MTGPPPEATGQEGRAIEPTRMRPSKGRVMHRVRRIVKGRTLYYEPLCKRIASTPASRWTEERWLGHQDCKHCPPEGAS